MVATTALRPRYQLADSREPTAPPRIRFLFVHRGAARPGQNVALHAHPFWQMELVMRGRARAVAGDDAFILTREHGVLIPSGIAHGFTYQADQTTYIALKFAVEGFAAPPRALLLTPESPVWWYRQAIERLLPVGSEPGHPDQPALEHLLTSLLCALLARPATPPPAAPEDFPTRAARALDTADGRPLSVSGLARALRLSPGRLHARFIAELGIAPKVWLDRRRAQASARLLVSSDLAIGDVAQASGFPDLAAFSRFFARVMGTSPRAYRRAGRVVAGEEPERRGRKK